jgi:hypothetical protein
MVQDMKRLTPASLLHSGWPGLAQALRLDPENQALQALHARLTP